MKKEGKSTKKLFGKRNGAPQNTMTLHKTQHLIVYCFVKCHRVLWNVVGFFVRSTFLLPLILLLSLYFESLTGTGALHIQKWRCRDDVQKCQIWWVGSESAVQIVLDGLTFPSGAQSFFKGVTYLHAACKICDADEKKWKSNTSNWRWERRQSPILCLSSNFCVKMEKEKKTCGSQRFAF